MDMFSRLKQVCSQSAFLHFFLVAGELAPQVYFSSFCLDPAASSSQTPSIEFRLFLLWLGRIPYPTSTIAIFCISWRLVSIQVQSPICSHTSLVPKAFLLHANATISTLGSLTHSQAVSEDKKLVFTEYQWLRIASAVLRSHAVCLFLGQSDLFSGDLICLFCRGSGCAAQE